MITDINLQTHNPDRVNIFVDGQYFCALAIWQVGELKLKVGQTIDKAKLEEASLFGKYYTLAVKYCLMRPHSILEVERYLHRKQIKSNLISQIIKRLKLNNYLDDNLFAKWWIENRHRKQGISQQKLALELKQKGINSEIIKQHLAKSDRDEIIELKKVISKKSKRYDDQQKLIKYLMGRGFRYHDIKMSLKEDKINY